MQRGGMGMGRGRGRGRGEGKGRGRGRGRGAQQPQQSGNKGPKHPDLPQGDGLGFCGMHHKFGRGAFFCSDPSSCPWKDIYTKKPTKQ